MFRGVVEREDGPSTAQLDDGDPAQREGQHPEARERQVEQREQGDLEHAVVADDDRPRLVRRRVAVARTCDRSASPAARPSARSLEDAGEGRPDAGVRPRRAIRRPAPRRRADRGASRCSRSPQRSLISRAAALPLALADLERSPARDGSARARRSLGGCGRHARRRSRRRGRSGEWTISRGAPSGSGRGRRPCGRASRARGEQRPGAAPMSDSGESPWPWNRPSATHSDSPWRRSDDGVEAVRDDVAGDRSAPDRVRASVASQRSCRGGSSTGRWTPSSARMASLEVAGGRRRRPTGSSARRRGARSGRRASR